VLMALFRGAGAEGLAGMRPRRRLADGIDLVRPLLHAGARELRHYVHIHALPYAVDPTNADASLRRNAVREALEALRPIFPGLDAAVARAAELTGSDLEGSDRAALRRQVRQALEEQEGLRDVDFAHVEAAVRALERGSSGRFHMKRGVELTVERGRLTSKP
jgi:tRNA(Ile)-lysidine synthase TilS/MesJ